MPELIVESLALRLSDTFGDRARIESITLRALDLLGDRLGELGGSQRPPAVAGVDPPSIDLDRETDEDVASVIADAWIQALRLRLEG